MSIKLPKIHLDSGNPEDTKKAKGLIGFLDGQTTNPSLVAKHPELQKRFAEGKKLTETELLDFYRQVVAEIEKEIAGPISVEVNANWESTASDMLKQAEKMFTWGRNIYIKIPTTQEGVKAAHEFVKSGGRVNMTLVFTEEQAAAVYAATLPTRQPAFLSPFMGRWDDRGYNGLDILKNALKMYRKFGKIPQAQNPNMKGKSHVQVLAASIRTMEHFYSSIFLGADIMTVPLSILYKWVDEEKWIPDEHYRASPTGLKNIVYKDLQFKPDFSKYKIEKEEGSLLDEGLRRFAADWTKLLITK